MARVVVTGGGGFVGKNLCYALRRMGHEVTSISRRHYSELEQAGITSVSADIAASAENLASHLEGALVLFHTAAHVKMWGPYEEFFRTNVVGTRNLLTAARRAGVPSFVYTSSPSVVADGDDLCGVDESCPYPARHHAHYPATKMVAEQEVRAASCPELLTVALRPHLIFGPGDTNLVPTIIARAKSGRLLRVGDGENLTDITFIDDCVSAHLCAWNALQSRADLGGRVYFISQGEPVNMWQWINTILAKNGLPPVQRSISARAALAAATASETWARLRGTEPLLTRFLVSEMTTSHYFNITAARRDLGFLPRYSVEEAMRVTFD